MRNSPVVFATTAVALAGLDLAHKTTVESTNLHPRSSAYVAVVLALALLWSAAILATRSVLLAQDAVLGASSAPMPLSRRFAKPS